MSRKIFIGFIFLFLIIIFIVLSNAFLFRGKISFSPSETVYFSPSISEDDFCTIPQCTSGQAEFTGAYDASTGCPIYSCPPTCKPQPECDGTLLIRDADENGCPLYLCILQPPPCPAPPTCDSGKNPVDTGRKDANNCAIYECPLPDPICARPICEEGEIVMPTGEKEANGCNKYTCIPEPKCIADVPLCPSGQLEPTNEVDANGCVKFICLPTPCRLPVCSAAENLVRTDSVSENNCRIYRCAPRDPIEPLPCAIPICGFEADGSIIRGTPTGEVNQNRCPIYQCPEPECPIGCNCIGDRTICPAPPRCGSLRITIISESGDFVPVSLNRVCRAGPTDELVPESIKMFHGTTEIEIPDPEITIISEDGQLFAQIPGGTVKKIIILDDDSVKEKIKILEPKKIKKIRLKKLTPTSDDFVYEVDEEVICRTLFFRYPRTVTKKFDAELGTLLATDKPRLCRVSSL